MYKANVRRILTEGEGDQLKAVGVQLLDGRTFKGQVNLCCVLSVPLTVPASGAMRSKCGICWHAYRHVRPK